MITIVHYYHTPPSIYWKERKKKKTMNGCNLKRKYEEINAVYSPPFQPIKSSLPTLEGSLPKIQRRCYHHHWFSLLWEWSWCSMVEHTECKNIEDAWLFRTFDCESRNMNNEPDFLKLRSEVILTHLNSCSLWGPWNIFGFTHFTHPPTSPSKCPLCGHLQHYQLQKPAVEDYFPSHIF